MDKMTTAAWIFMLSAWGLIIAGTAYCFFKLLTGNSAPDDADGSSAPPP